MSITMREAIPQRAQQNQVTKARSFYLSPSINRNILPHPHKIVSQRTMQKYKQSPWQRLLAYLSRQRGRENNYLFKLIYEPRILGIFIYRCVMTSENFHVSNCFLQLRVYGQGQMRNSVDPTHGGICTHRKEQLCLLLQMPIQAVHLKREFYIFFLQFPTSQDLGMEVQRNNVTYCCQGKSQGFLMKYFNHQPLLMEWQTLVRLCKIQAQCG